MTPPKATTAALVLAGLSVFTPDRIEAATYNAASTSRTDVTNAIAQATLEGDIVNIPAGTSTWASAAVITKGITIIGAGTNSTRLINSQSASTGLEGAVFDINLAADERMRVTGIYFQDENLNTDSDGIRISGSTAKRKIRIDHCMFHGFSWGVKDEGRAFGCGDNNYFFDCDTFVRHQGYNTIASLPVAGAPYPWNSTNTFCWEDNIFQWENFNEDSYICDTEHPADYTFRYNTILAKRPASPGRQRDGFDLHGENGGEVIPIGPKVYKNTMTFTGANSANTCKFVDWRGGANSLSYSNTLIGLSVAGKWMFRDDYGGSHPTNMYAWADISSPAFAAEFEDSVVENTHYFLSSPAGFAQMVYPHPLREELVGPPFVRSPPGSRGTLGGR